jgi:predicted metal-dependent peptidase
MKLEIKAAILTAAFIIFVIVAGTTIYFLPEVAATILFVFVGCVIIYHIYNDILSDLRRVEKDKLIVDKRSVDPKRDRM